MEIDNKSIETKLEAAKLFRAFVYLYMILKKIIALQRFTHGKLMKIELIVKT